jgi:cytochrome c oxidase cbb3-type subunit 4
MVLDFIVEYQGYLYFIFTVLLATIFYWYIYHLYKSEKTGRRNYEKYGDIAINDDINDTPVESMPNRKSKLNNKGEQK